MDEMFRQNVQTIYFDFDKSDIRPDQVPRVEADASWLKEHRGLKFRIEGHCDERGSEEYNLALGDRRANRVKEFLINKRIDTSTLTRSVMEKNVRFAGKPRKIATRGTGEPHSC